MENSINKRIKEIIKREEITQKEFCLRIGVPESTLKTIFMRGSNPSLELIIKVSNEYQSYSLDWILKGEERATTTKSIPYYSDLPVSAGSLELANIPGNEIPTGYINLPGVNASWYFPVTGCSMQPEINPGDIIGVNIVERWERVDPDKVYMIVTTEERMIKRLRVDNEDDAILWAISNNYPEFRIRKADILHIFQVVFHGQLM